MHGPPALCEDDLAGQTIELLPGRHTLWSINVANVIGVNVALAINAASFHVSAMALAQQQLAAALKA